MFWITFFVSGLLVASIPWVASHFGNHVAGYVVLLPIILTLSLIVQYVSHGENASIEMLRTAFWALPTLLVFIAVAIIALKNHLSLPLAIVLSLAAWFVVVLLIQSRLGK